MQGGVWRLTKKLQSSRSHEVATGYLFILPQLLFFLVFLLYPVLEGFRMSTYDISLTTENFIGFDHYLTLFQDTKFIKSLINTVILIFWVTIISVALAFIVACAIFDKRDGYITFIRGSFYIPTIISMVVVATIWKWMLNPSFGIIYYVLGKFGITDQNWLGNSGTVLYVMIFILVLMNVGQAILLYVAAMRGLDPALFEAADIDGATRLQKVRLIIYPLVKSTTLYLIVWHIIGVMKSFVIMNVMTGGGPNYASSTLMYLTYTEAFRTINMGRGAAIGVIMFIVTIILSMLQFRLFRRKDGGY